MPIPRWSEAFKLGNEAIDDDHQRLFELLEWLEGKLLREDDLEPPELHRVVSELNRHVEEHFHREESMMKNLSVMPQSEKNEHQTDHIRWSEKLAANLPSLVNARTDLERRGHLARLLLIGKAFWAEHFIEFDQKLAGFLKP